MKVKPHAKKKLKTKRQICPKLILKPENRFLAIFFSKSKLEPELFLCEIVLSFNFLHEIVLTC